MSQNKHKTAFSFIFQELVATSGNERNWKGMLIAAAVILAVMGMITLSVLLLTPPKEEGDEGRRFDFADFLRGNLSGRGFNGTWISGTGRNN